MRIKTDFPYAIREIENAWIPMSDGARLAARIWLPTDAHEHPVPAILEYLPYRKDDATAARDAIRHPYFAGHGYAAIRVDMRGSGDSDGILFDEYLPQEQDDALEVLAWIAAQPWCTGAVGMIGISWGGFNALQIAARRPPQLKAVISLCSTDDRYADDVHYMGGCLLAAEALPWASTMLAYNARPPDPRHVGDGWRALWLDRMERTPPFIEAWLSHQTRDAFWKHGSVCENFADIESRAAPATGGRGHRHSDDAARDECPVYVVGGWADGYTNAVLRLLAGLTAPRKGLIGPWAHAYPEKGVPGPSIGFLQEALRWWDYWLKGIESGVMEGPLLRVWMLDSIEASTHHADWPGRWVAEPAWPSPNIATRTYWLNDHTLDPSAQAEVILVHEGAQVAGLDAGVWCPYGTPGDFPPDQRAEDGLSLTFTSAPLEQPIEILGFPEVTLSVAVDRPQALLAVRLCDISPDGHSTLITRGLLNLTHREGHEQPAPLETGKRYPVSVRLNAIAWALPAGHCWRVALSPTYWPFAWPSPEPVTLRVYGGAASYLQLPTRPARAEDAALPPFLPAEGATPLAVEVLRRESREREVRRDDIRSRVQLTDRKDKGAVRFSASGLEYDVVSTETFTIVEGDPLSAEVRCDWVIKIGRGDWRTRVETTSLMSSDAERFLVTNILHAYEGNARVFAKTWHFSVPRNGV